MMPDPAAAADAGAVAPLPDPAALAQPPAPALPPVAADAFTPPADPNAAAPDLGAADAATPGALQDFLAAKQDLRQARQEAPGAQRRHDVRHARKEVRQAKQALNNVVSGGRGTADAFVGQTAVDTKALGNLANANQGAPQVATKGAAQAQPAPAGLALGHTLPAISQLHPKGEGQGYANGEMNCAPTAMAMVARGFPGATLDGKPVAQMPDAELINRLGKHGQTDKNGTSPNGVIAMAEDMGLSTSTRMGGLDQNYVDSVLARGGSVVANGAYPIEGELAGHFVTVTAKTQDGHYLVNDPLQGTVEYTPAQLDAFLRSNPENGGVSIGIV